MDVQTLEPKQRQSPTFEVKSNNLATCVEALLVVVVAFAFSVYFLYPLSFHMGTHLRELGDSRLNAFIQAWDTHALLHDPVHLFHTNMYYPAKFTLAGSENLLGNQPLFTPAYLLTGNPAWAMNFVIVASFVLCAMTMYLLVRRMTGDPFAAAIAGFVYGFALPRIGQLNHMQLLSTQWIPLIILCLYSYLLTKQIRKLAGMAGFLLLQIFCSLYLGYLAVMITACFLVAVLATRRDLITPAVRNRLLCAMLAVVLVLLPIVVPYLYLQRHGAIPASQKADAVNGSANPIASYLDVAGFPNHIYRNLLHGFDSHELGGEKRLFMGFLPMTLALVGLFALERPKRGVLSANPGGLASPSVSELQNSFVLGCVLTLLVAYILSLGPYLRVHDQATHLRLPLAILMRYVPGMGVFRVPARFGFAVLFGVAALAGLGFRRMATALSGGKPRNARITKALLLVVAIAVMTVEFSGRPIPMEPVMAPSNVAPEYVWLSRQPAGSVVLELPITWARPDFPDPFEQAGYIYASTYHWQPLMNGYTGYRPRFKYDTYQLASGLPENTESLNQLAKLGLHFIVVHTDKLSSSELVRWLAFPAHPGLQLVTRFNDGAVVYEVKP